MIIKISDLEDFLNELIEYNVEKQKEYDDKLNDLIGRLESDNEEWVQSFIDNQKFRLDLFNTLSRFEHHMISSYIRFLTVCIDKVWERCQMKMVLFLCIKSI